MKSCLLFAAVPPVFSCSNPSTHACAGAFVSSSAEAASFCATFTAAVVTATDAVPTALLDACDGSVKHLSSACECYVTGGVGAGTPTAVASSEVQVPGTPSTLVTFTRAASTQASTPEYTSEESTPEYTSEESTPEYTSESNPEYTSESTPESTSSTPDSSTPAATSAAAAATTASGSGDSSVVVGANACTVTEYAQISSAVASCTNIVLSGVSMPASSTLDLQSLQTGAVVTFEGTTSFGTTADEDFDPIVVSGHSITIQGASGHVIDGNGATYWDGQGSNGGSSK